MTPNNPDLLKWLKSYTFSGVKYNDGTNFKSRLKVQKPYKVKTIFNFDKNCWEEI